MKMCWFTTITLSLVCLSGCKTGADKGVNIVTPENFSRIVDRQWLLRMMIVDDKEYGLTGERPLVKFSGDGKVSGFASINRFSGSMQWDDQGKIQWSPLLSTRMAGPPELMDQESVFLTALSGAQHLSLKGIHLHARSEDEQTELVFYVPEK
jgi:heat shock protein HslJ